MKNRCSYILLVTLSQKTKTKFLYNSIYEILLGYQAFTKSFTLISASKLKIIYFS